MKDIYLNPNLYDALHNDIGTDESVIKYYAKKCMALFWRLLVEQEGYQNILLI